MIDAGTISASLILDTEPFANGLNGALTAIALLGGMSGEQGNNIGTLGDALAMVGARTYSDFQSPLVTAAQSVKDSCLSISESVQSASVEVEPSAQALRNNILTPLRETVSGGTSIMINFGQGLINGLASKQASIIAKARSIANSVASTMRNALGIASPSRVMREIGRFTAEGMVLGLQDMSTEVERASRGLAQGAVTAVSADTAVQSSEKVFEPQKAFPEQIKTGEQTYQDILSHKLDTLIDLLSGSRQSIELDRRTFGVLVREYT